MSLTGIESINRILRNIRRRGERKDAKFSDLYNLMKKETFAQWALGKLTKNKGINTAGDDEKLDRFSQKKLKEINEELVNRTYNPVAVKRICIPKPGKRKQRPLGLPSIKDKIVQQMLYEILNAVYEPYFDKHQGNRNFGFRRGFSVQGAMEKIDQQAKNTRWCIEGDIEGAYDNVDHGILINIIRERVSDNKIIQLISKMLKSGVMIGKRREETYVGIPQGGIISPLLFNIYMSKFDDFIIELEKEQENKNKEERRGIVRNPDYVKIQNQTGGRARYLRTKQEKFGPNMKHWNEKDRQIALKKLKEIKKLTHEKQKIDSRIQSKMPHRMIYVRYADNWVIFLNGEKSRAERMKTEIEKMLMRKLKLTLSPEKTKISDLRKKRANFLGFSMGYPVKGPRIIKTTFGRNRRTTGYRLRFGVDRDRMLKKFENGGFLKGKRSLSKSAWTVKTEHEIVQNFNSIIRGLIGYWSQGIGTYNEVQYYVYILQTSCLLTLAHKGNTSVGKIVKKYGTNVLIKEPGVGRERRVELIRYREAYDMFARFQERRHRTTDDPITYTNWRTLKRLSENCVICGSEKDLEMHHVNKIKNITATGFKKIMIQLQRKQIVVCKNCHLKIHRGELDSIKLDLHDRAGISLNKA